MRGDGEEVEEDGGEGREEAASVPTLNDSLGQSLPHMLSGEREARMQTQTNRWRGERGIKRGKTDQDRGILKLSNWLYKTKETDLTEISLRGDS